MSEIGPASELSHAEFGQLLAVATLYVDAFKDDELLSLTEKMRLQEIEAILEKYGRAY